MNNFKEYYKPATQLMTEYVEGMDLTGVSISTTDKENGSPKKGDMIAVNRKNKTDKWLVSKEFFNNNYLEVKQNSTKNLSYGQAIEALKGGNMIAREGWNGKGMFVFKQIPAEIGLDIIPKMQSVPQSVKDEMVKNGTILKYTNQMAIVNIDGRVDSWVASSSDTFANDWLIL